MANKRKSFGNTDLNMDSGLDELFSSDNKQKTEEPKEQKLRTFASIRDFFKNDKEIKQYSYYLPPELQNKLKAKAIEDDKSVSDVIRSLVMEHFLTDEDIKDAYERGYERRNPQDK